MPYLEDQIAINCLESSSPKRTLKCRETLVKKYIRAKVFFLFSVLGKMKEDNVSLFPSTLDLPSPPAANQRSLNPTTPSPTGPDGARSNRKAHAWISRHPTKQPTATNLPTAINAILPIIPIPIQTPIHQTRTNIIPVPFTHQTRTNSHIAVDIHSLSTLAPRHRQKTIHLKL